MMMWMTVKSSHNSFAQILMKMKIEYAIPFSTIYPISDFQFRADFSISAAKPNEFYCMDISQNNNLFY